MTSPKVDQAAFNTYIEVLEQDLPLLMLWFAGEMGVDQQMTEGLDYDSHRGFLAKQSGSSPSKWQKRLFQIDVRHHIAWNFIV